jgi:hypothetical protein
MEPSILRFGYTFSERSKHNSSASQEDREFYTMCVVGGGEGDEIPKFLSERQSKDTKMTSETCNEDFLCESDLPLQST